ncbi:MAG: MaoC/PaaZ C-terminal domain-containing protein [Planctomycetota bacterium]|jgi:acyl dehydratase
MDTPILPRRIPQAPVVGERAAFTRTLTEADVALFVGVTWDVNPYHTDDTYVGATRFGQRIVPGLLTASLLTHLGGLWAFLATKMQFEFLAPVYIGDTVTAEVEVVEAEESRGWVRLDCRCTNTEAIEVLRAEIIGYPGRFEG